MSDSPISDWIDSIITGCGGLHDFEHYELAIPNGDRDVATAKWVIRCLANPKCAGSAETLKAIIEHRESK